jgi:hypothetical protein
LCTGTALAGNDSPAATGRRALRTQDFANLGTANSPLAVKLPVRVPFPGLPVTIAEAGAARGDRLVRIAAGRARVSFKSCPRDEDAVQRPFPGLEGASCMPDPNGILVHSTSIASWTLISSVMSTDALVCDVHGRQRPADDQFSECDRWRRSPPIAPAGLRRRRSPPMERSACRESTEREPELSWC